MKPRKGIKLLLCGLLAPASISAGASEDQAVQETPERPTIVIGAATEAILSIQREGSAAGTLHPIRGEVASRSYQRYLDSYSRPIPEPNQNNGAGFGSAPQANTADRSPR